jgi:glucan phosphoethanolaminetransferase (alkaline phosphatase superfamily)
MTELTSNNKILESLQKKQSLNTTIIRILLAGLTILFFAFIPIGLSSSQSVILIISAGIGFIGNIIASYLVNKNKLNIGMLISIFSFNIAYLGISAIYKNLGALSFLLIIVPTTILIFSYLSDNLKVPVFITTNLLGLLAVLFDFFLRNLPSRIYLQENTLQLIYTIYLVLIVFISAIYIINYLRLIKYFPIKSRMDSNQSIALTLGISLILLLVFANNYSSSISESQSEISSSIDQISYSIENFYNKQSLSIQNTAELSIFTEYIENE